MTHKAVILLVEDNRMDVELTLDAFREVRMENDIRVARTGEEALEYLLGQGTFADRKQNPLPDLVLLDLKLPGINGHDVLRRIKQTPLIKRLPVIILTSSKEESDRAAGYDCGVNSYLVKPVSFSGFLDVIKSVENYWMCLNVKPPLPEQEETDASPARYEGDKDGR